MTAAKQHNAPESGPRRTGGRRLGGRSERVVRDVLRATTAELARAGYAALRVEDVAARARVNKTTIYRRWPTKAELVSATLRAAGGPPTEAPDTGTVRGDLMALLRAVVAKLSTPAGRGLYRMITLEMDHPEVASIARVLRAESQVPWVRVIERAILRGELPEGSDPQLIAELIRGPVLSRLLRLREPVDEAYVEAVVNLVVLGAERAGAVRAAKRGQ